MRLIILLLVCTGLAFAALYDFTSSENDDRIALKRAELKRLKQSNSNKDSTTENRIAIRNPYDNLKLSSLQQTVKRPLFTQSRRPPAPIKRVFTPPKITRAPQKPEPQFLLLGVLKNGTKSVALVRQEDTGKYFRVVKGDFIGNIRVKDVLLKAVKLEKEDGTSTMLKLKFTKP